MCLAIPMQIESIDGVIAQCSAGGIERTINLFLVSDQAIEPGDHVLVHVGYAIQKVTSEQAQTTWESLEQFFDDNA